MRSGAVAGCGSVVAIALAACLPAERKAPPMPAHYQGRLAIRAAAIAAPRPPQTLDEELAAGNRLAQVSFDEDHDGALNFDEWIEQEFAAFLIYNASHDGKLKYDEYRRYYYNLHGGLMDEAAERETQARFHELDRGHKGYLLIDDIHDLAFSSFALNDVNHDRRVTPTEIAEVAKGGAPHLLP